jgi:hypothetical protein
VSALAASLVVVAFAPRREAAPPRPSGAIGSHSEFGATMA